MTIPPTNKILPLLTCLLISASFVRAETIPGLGTATFPTSTHSAAAAQEFMRGLLLLHVFEYDDASSSFVAAEKEDPGFAMAYWGEAMTFNHPVWNEHVPCGSPIHANEPGSARLKFCTVAPAASPSATPATRRPCSG
jgi:hypothetical protein